MPSPPWDYLIVTASHAAQARAYEAQLEARLGAGRLARVGNVQVVADLEGRRIGSGGSTLECLRLVLNRERRGRTAEETLRDLRILIVHAGGDSRRLPAYGPCGKIFVPVPGHNESQIPLTLFDLLAPSFLDLPPAPGGAGQIVVAAGDALLRFDPAGVRFSGNGMTMLGSKASPEEASRHGVFCADRDGEVQLYLQKPSRAEQEAMGALDGGGLAALDIGVTSLDAPAAATLLDAFGVTPDAGGNMEWNPGARARLLDLGIDLYREICCAMGTGATLEHYRRTARGAGSQWDDDALAGLFTRLRGIPFRVDIVPGCRFLHFGSTRQLVESGLALATEQQGTQPASTCLCLNNRIGTLGKITGEFCWVEGCRINAPVMLRGRNVVIGLDIDEPLELPEHAALDVVEGQDGWFVRCYGTGDSFKDATYCGQPLREWVAGAGGSLRDIWSADTPAAEQTLWNARMFPLEREAGGFRRWLWMYTPESATPEQKSAWQAAARFSAAEIAVAARQDAFHRRRAEILTREVTC